MTWKTYEVTLIRSEIYKIELKARSKDEAMMRGEEKSDDAEYHGCLGFDVENVVEIKS